MLVSKILAKEIAQKIFGRWKWKENKLDWRSESEEVWKNKELSCDDSRDEDGIALMGLSKMNVEEKNLMLRIEALGAKGAMT